jgi:hypothetical protein
MRSRLIGSEGPGSSSVGFPFLIGAGYLLVWKLEGPKDKVPPLP